MINEAKKAKRQVTILGLYHNLAETTSFRKKKIYILVNIMLSGRYANGTGARQTKFKSKDNFNEDNKRENNLNYIIS